MVGLFSIAAVWATKENKGETTAPLSFEQVYEHHFAFAWRSLRGLGVGESVIDDAAQELFIVVHRKLNTVTDPEKIKSWIFAIARRIASDYRRSEKRRGTAIELDESRMDTSVPDPHQQVVSKQTITLVEEFLSELDEERRAIFVLSEIEQLPAAQIADALDINMNTIYTRLKVMKNNLILFMAKRMPEK